jgi:RNA polymerase sigma factor (TIGR02999 family)
LTEAEGDHRGDITLLLQSWRAGDAGAFNSLFAAVYDELRVLARRQLRRAGGGPALDTTAVIHEAYLKLVDQTRAQVRDRHHFFALAAKAMRHILVDHARRRGAQKRGGGQEATLPDDPEAPVLAQAAEIVAVDEALARLEAVDERLGRIVELRFFGGLSVEETADALEISPRTVKRDWQKARAFLYHELTRQS